MANLLPDKIKKTTERERLGRFIVVLCCSTAVILAVIMISLVPSFFLVSFATDNLEKRKQSAEELAEVKGLGGLELEIERLNNLLDLLKQGSQQIRTVSDDFFNVLSQVSLPVRLDSFNFSGPFLIIGGHSSTRNDLVDFIDALKVSGHFKNIDSPVSNLLLEKDVDFSIVLELDGAKQ